MQRLIPPGARSPSLPPEWADPTDQPLPARATATATRSAPGREGRARETGDAGAPRLRTLRQRRCHAVRCAEADAEIRAAWARHG